MAKRSIFLIKVLCIFIIMVVFSALTACHNKKSTKEIFNFWVYPSGSNGSYRFTLYDDRTLKAVVGFGGVDESALVITEDSETYEVNKGPISVDRIIDEGEDKLSRKQYNRICELLDTIYTDKNIKTDTRWLDVKIRV